MFQSIRVLAVNQHPRFEVHWPYDLTHEIHRNEEVLSATGDAIRCWQEHGPSLIQSLAAINLNLWEASSISITGEMAGSTLVAVVPNPRAARFGIRSLANPAMGRTRLVLSNDEPGPFEVEFYDVSGRRLDRWAFARLSPGSHVMTWDPPREISLQSGVIYVRMKSHGEVRATRFVFLR
jgi:hypothetical protein